VQCRGCGLSGLVNKDGAPASSVQISTRGTYHHVLNGPFQPSRRPNPPEDGESFRERPWRLRQPMAPSRTDAPARPSERMLTFQWRMTRRRRRVWASAACSRTNFGEQMSEFRQTPRGRRVPPSQRALHAYQCGYAYEAAEKARLKRRRSGRVWTNRRPHGRSHGPPDLVLPTVLRIARRSPFPMSLALYPLCRFK